MNKAQDRFGRAISIINRKAFMYFSYRLKHLSLGPGQQAYLMAIEPDEIISQDELAQRLVVDKANVSRAVRGLEKLQYIRRELSAKDNRKVELQLTPRGLAAKKEIEVIAHEWITKLKDYVSEDEWDAAEQALERIAASLEGFYT